MDKTKEISNPFITLPIQLLDKTCACGLKAPEIPVEAKINEAGYWWNCSCKSTLFLPKKKLRTHTK